MLRVTQPLRPPAGSRLASIVQRQLPQEEQQALQRRLQRLPGVVHHPLGTLYEEPALVVLVLTLAELQGLGHLLAGQEQQGPGGGGGSGLLGGLGSKPCGSGGTGRSQVWDGVLPWEVSGGDVRLGDGTNVLSHERTYDAAAVQ